MTIQQYSDTIARKQKELDAIFALPSPTIEQAKTSNALAIEIEKLTQNLMTLKKFDEEKRHSRARAVVKENYNDPSAPAVKGLPVSDDAHIGTAFKGLRSKVFSDTNDSYKLGLLFLGNVCDHAPSRTKMADIGMKTKTMWEGDNNLGGALVPTEIASQIINLVEQYGVGAQYLRQETMASETKEIVRLKHGMSAFWGAEKAVFTASDENSDRVQLTARKLYVYTAHTIELEEDSIIALGDAIATEMAREGARKLDDAIFNGDGTSAYGGIFGIAASLLALSATIPFIAGLQVATGNLYSEVTLADLVALEARLPQYAVTSNLAWYMSRAVYGAIVRRLITSASVGGLTATELINGLPVDTFLGYPVRITQVMPKTEANSQVCLLLGDLSQTGIYGKRSQIVMARDTSKGFDSDLVYLKSTWRHDVVIHDVGNASATASLRVAGPTVGLITAAS